ncbi:hypothetical protein F0241_13075 [Vibrio kanaloae]|nr:hypothetical protein [Vibrio kanaloae]
MLFSRNSPCCYNAALSGELRPTTLNKTTLITALQFATKTAQRCESVLNALLITKLPQARDSNKPQSSPQQTNLNSTGC